MFVLDTDHLTLVERSSNEEARRLRARLDQATTEDWATTIVTYEEQSRGWLAYLAGARKLAQLVDAYGKLGKHLDNYRPLRVLAFDERAAAEFQRLRQSKLRIGTMDLKIAAIVLAHDATLLSRNTKDFGKVPGLQVEDWTT